jgi:hypothetical protein
VVFLNPPPAVDSTRETGMRPGFVLSYP